MKQLAFLFSSCFLSCAAISAPSSGASVGHEWEASPLGWKIGANAAESASAGGFAISRNAPRAAKVTVSATLTPLAAGTNGWATLGVSVFDAINNYWHLALVQAPPANKSVRAFELCECRNGTWVAQAMDKLKVEREEWHGSWQYGEKYFLVIATDGKGVQGEIRDSSGKLVYAKRYAFPAPSADGKVAAVTCGRPALHANGGFIGTFEGIATTSAEPVAKMVKACPQYSSDSFVPSVKDAATGFFRVVRRADGRWWTIDPLGRGFVPMGVDHVRYGGHWSERTRRSVHHEVNKKKFPDKRDWEEDSLRRLKGWGFNMLGAGCDDALRHRGLVHTVFLSMGDGLCRDELNDSLWICPNEHRPCSAFPNVFDPLFPEWCDYVARMRCAPNKDDPWLFGYFIDNELAWWGRGKSGTGLFDAVMKKPETHSAKIALRAFLKERGVTGAASDSVKLDFLRLAAERYFSCAAGAIRKYDPNHLVMGARFAGLHGAHDIVWEVSGKYCDLVTFNIYPWANLDRNVMFTGSELNAQRVADAFAERYAIVKKPMLVTEWSFPALDSGLPCTGGAGQRFRTQKERTAATELFAKTMLASPSILGYDYFMWVDEPEEGISDAFPEDSNYGLINLQGEEYPELTAMFAALQKDVGRWRSAPLPKEKVVNLPPKITASIFAARLPAPASKGGVSFSRSGDEYSVTTRGGLELSGRIGAKPVFRRVALNGVELGSYSTMVNYDRGGLIWQDITEITDVRFEERRGWGVLSVSGKWLGYDGSRGFALYQKIAVHPDMPYFICDVMKVVNIGKGDLDFKAIYFRQCAPYAKDKNDSNRKIVPNLWKALCRDAWVRASDGAWWGGLTTSPACTTFRYFLQNNGQSQHPDAMFMPMGKAPAGSPDGLWRLAPGETYAADGTMWMLCIGGSGGQDGWNRACQAIIPESACVP